MTPFYQEDGITIYCGDCREILPSLGEFDLLLTDPPYPKLLGGQDRSKMGGGVAKPCQPSVSVGTPWGDDIEGVEMAARKSTQGLMVFCSFHSVDTCAKNLPGRRVGLITWWARNSAPSIQNAPRFQTEFVWVYATGVGLLWRKLETLYDIPKLQGGCMADERITDENGKSLHPCQKPVGLMLALLGVSPRTVCDPYMGTGTTLLAAKLKGLRATGIEINEDYCRLAVERLRQGVLIPA